MFPRLRQKLGTALVDRIDLVVEFSTLGEYALAEDLMPVAVHTGSPATGAECTPAVPPSGDRRRVRGDCSPPEPSLSRRPSD